MPTHTHPVTRDSDDELVGYVVDAGQNRWTPTTVFGAPLDGPLDRDEAESSVRAAGLAILAEPWEYRDDDGQWRRAHIVEASPARVTLMRGEFYPDPTTRFTIAAPVGDRLRPRRR